MLLCCPIYFITILFKIEISLFFLSKCRIFCVMGMCTVCTVQKHYAYGSYIPRKHKNQHERARVCVCVCVYVCEKERDRETERVRKGTKELFQLQPLILTMVIIAHVKRR